jgi:hypothetical protein
VTERDPDAEPDADELDRTVVVDRAADADELDRTVVVDRPVADADVDELDRTVVVDRGAEAGAEELDRTVVVDRAAGAGADELDRTVVVDRGAGGDEDELDRTIVVEAGGTIEFRDEADADAEPDDERAARPVDGGDATSAPVATDSRRIPDAPPALRRARRRAVTLPPSGMLSDRAVAAPGPGAIATYGIRPIPEAARRTPAEAADAAAARADAVPSVARRSRATALATAAAIAGALVVSVAGFVVLASVLLG